MIRDPWGAPPQLRMRKKAHHAHMGADPHLDLKGTGSAAQKHSNLLPGGMRCMVRFWSRVLDSRSMALNSV